jgi:hypothetical protein
MSSVLRVKNSKKKNGRGRLIIPQVPADLGGNLELVSSEPAIIIIQ